MRPFHLAFPVRDLASTRAFYAGTLGCPVGREADTWIDFDLFGHQISAHVRPEALRPAGDPTNPVDGDAVPVRHFGVVLPWAEWTALAARLQAKGVVFLIEPRVRFAGEVGEQGTFFIQDPSQNALEFKSFKDQARLFARQIDPPLS